MKVFYATGLSILFNEEAFLIELRFQGEAETETLCLVLPPSGAKTLQLTLKQKLEEYETQYNKQVKPWPKNQPNKPKNGQYLA
ncbi:hypothetical protein J7K27_06285 [Candidatus Bathyarchaeota archaeon]|nr:hypothetical protein [Candidatus Bathyarchaeota archaeon]